jgi:hypothetical protein
MHQTLLKKIKAHQPKVDQLIDGYNALVDKLMALNKASYHISIPPNLDHDLCKMQLDGLHLRCLDQTLCCYSSTVVFR